MHSQLCMHSLLLCMNGKRAFMCYDSSESGSIQNSLHSLFLARVHGSFSFGFQCTPHKNAFPRVVFNISCRAKRSSDCLGAEGGGTGHRSEVMWLGTWQGFLGQFVQGLLVQWLCLAIAVYLPFFMSKEFNRKVNRKNATSHIF